MTTRGTPSFGKWAVARADSVGGLVLAGFQPGDNASGDLFLLQLTRNGVGTLTCGSVYDTGREPIGCHGRLVSGVNPETLEVAGETYSITAGSVSVLERTDANIRGTFHFTLKSADNSRTITVPEGSFDLPIATDRDMSNGIACLARNVTTGRNEPC